MHFHIRPSHLSGEIAIPPSKSHTIRAILFAMMASGKSIIENPLISPDAEKMVDAICSFGAKVMKKNSLEIEGVNGRPPVFPKIIDAGNSGILFRFMTALSALFPHTIKITGDASICNLRPIQPLLTAIQQLGGKTEKKDGIIQIQGPINPGKITVSGEDSQIVSSLLIATSFLPLPTEINVINPGETPWVDLTLHWLQKLGIVFTRKNHSFYRNLGNGRYPGFSYSVPGDFSTAAFSIAAAIVTHSALTLTNLDMSDIQGDKQLIFLLQEMGAEITIDQIEKKIMIKPNCDLKGKKIDINPFIDALPILAVLGCFAKGKTEIFNGKIARKKESDRIAAICQELAKMGAKIREKEDGLIVEQSDLCGANVDSHQDHRIALALSIAALAAKGPSTISNIEFIQKSYPNFMRDFQTIGAQIIEIS